MGNLTFEQEIWLLAIDKLALGAFIGLIAFIGNRALERYRSRQIILEEAARLRLAKIAPLWDELNNIHYILQSTYLRACGICQTIDAKHGGINYRLENNLKLLQPLPESVENFAKELLPQIENTEQKIITFQLSLVKNDYWLGRKLTTMLNNHAFNLMALSLCLKNLLQSDEVWNLGKIYAAFHKVEWSKINIEEISKLL